MGLRDYMRIYLDGQEIGTAYRGTVQILGGAPTVPGEVIVTLSAQPASGGTPVTGFVYRIDDGEVRPLGPGLGLHGLSGLAPGAEISIRIAAINGVGQGPWSTAKTVTVKAETIAPPVALTDPAVTGALSQGATLTASEGVWSGSPALTVQWLRNGVAIAGATGTSHVLTAADSGAMLSVLVTATNAGGTVAALSPAVEPVEAAVIYEFETYIVILAYGQSNEQAQNNSGGQPYLSSDQDSTGRICRWDATTGAAVATGQPMAGWPLVTQMGPAPTAPVVVSDDTIRITVSDPQPPAYVIEYRAAGSSDAWTEQIVFPETWIDAPGTFDVAVAGTGNREVRLKARSYAGTSAAGASVTVAEALADGGWSITAGDASAAITSAPASPATPVIALGGDTTATIAA